MNVHAQTDGHTCTCIDGKLKDRLFKTCIIMYRDNVRNIHVLAWVQSSIFSIANIKKKEKKKIPHQRYRLSVIDMRGSRKFFQRGSNFDYVFFFFFFFFGGGVGGREDPNTNISGSSSARQ